MKAVIESARPLLEKCRRHCIDELAAKCQTMENAERENASAIGIGDDDYRPSGMLESLREQHRRALAAVNDQPTKGELMAL